MPEHGLPSDNLVVRTGPLVIDCATGAVMLYGRPVALTRTERALLAALAARLDEVVTHRCLLSTVWGEQYDDSHYLRIYISALRRKLEAHPSRPRLLLTRWGVGYRLATLPVETLVEGPVVQAPAPQARPVEAARRPARTLEAPHPRPRPVAELAPVAR